MEIVKAIMYGLCACTVAWVIYNFISWCNDLVTKK